MTVANLMYYKNDATFAFDHYMAHSQFYGAMFPLDRFSVLPYLLDPIPDPNLTAAYWNLNHQQAHNDFINSLPTYFGAVTTGLPMGQNLIDINLNDPENVSWLSFVNMLEHQMGGVVVPDAADSPWVFPFA